MSLSNLIRWGGVAAMLAGALFVAADLLSLSISPKFPSSESLLSEPYAIQSVLKLVGAALLLLGLLGLHARQADTAGPLGTAGFLAAFSGTALAVGSFWATAFFAPAMAASDPAGFDALQGPPGRLADAFVVTIAAFVLGWGLFGLASWRARVYPRGDLDLEAEVLSDTRSVLPLVRALKETAGAGLRFMRDPTRGGVGTVLNELARDSGYGVALWEERIPVREIVTGACEILGLDPLYIANEGKILAVVSPESADAALEALRKVEGGEEAAIIGEVREEPERMVLMHTGFGGTRMIDMLVGDPLPRIC